MFAVLFGGAVSLLPAFIKEILHYGPEGLGILRAAPALGAVAVGLWLARHPIDRNAGRILLFAVAAILVVHVVISVRAQSESITVEEVIPE